MVLFAAIRERLADALIPEAFSGTPITLITAGILSMAFMGFSGFGA
jgi:electron transport complex protein RnfA